jgi:hypothetical protein
MPHASTARDEAGENTIERVSRSVKTPAAVMD